MRVLYWNWKGDYMNDRYFNFPIQLLSGFLLNHQTCLKKVLYYSLYKYGLTLTGNQNQRIKASAEYFGVSLGDMSQANEMGSKLVDDFPSNSPMTGIATSVFWKYYGDQKQEWDKVILLAFLAMKSILGDKPYMKIDNKYWLSRMAGERQSIPYQCLPPEIYKYKNEYQTKKLKHELSESWGLVTYSRYTRGFFISFKMPLKDLILEAEKKRRSNRLLRAKKEQQEALQEVLKELGIREPT